MTTRAAVKLAVLGTCILGCAPTFAGEAAPPSYLEVVRKYADTMLDRGRDEYGATKSPLFAEALDRTTLKMLEGDALEKASAIKEKSWGIRPQDRQLICANPMHCENLYQILYALTQATGEKKYAAEADASLKFFLEHCQSKATGLFYWGEHSGWDLQADAAMKTVPGRTRVGDTHEFYRPWVLWDRCWELAPDACRAFALGLWEHQIADHQTGDYSRHAAIAAHGPGKSAPYARHGGFYIETWAEAYRRTKDPVFLKAIDVILDTQRQRWEKEGGMVRAGSGKTPESRTMTELSLMISLFDAAPKVPDELAARMRSFAVEQDKIREKSADANLAHLAGIGPETNVWSSGYSSGDEVAGKANTTMLRYRQVPLDFYRKLILASADVYLKGEVNLSFPVYPGTLGKVIILMINANELSGDEKYLDRADYYAQQAIKLFLDGNPLPKATHTFDHYEAITEADTLMMSLLQLWAVRQQPAFKLSLVYSDR